MRENPYWQDVERTSNAQCGQIPSTNRSARNLQMVRIAVISSIWNTLWATFAITLFLVLLLEKVVLP
jgi:hypothetical protein